MIHFDFDWSDSLNQLIILLMAALLMMQLWLLFRKDGEGKWLRAVLNVLLWLAVLAFIIQPYILKKTSSHTGLLFGKDVPSAFREKLKDSLKRAEIITTDKLKDNRFDTLLLVGQDFGSVLFSTLEQIERKPSAVRWISHPAPDRAENMTWNGIVRKGEQQIVRGSIISSKKEILKLRYGNQTLDSLALRQGVNTFKMSFPVFTQGRTAVELAIGQSTLDTLRFFARPAESLTFQFMLDNPDFESRLLATWLGKNGHSVLYTAKLSKAISTKQTINKARDPDIVITDAGNASDALVKKAVASGKSVLLINLFNPAQEVSAINSALGTKLQIRKISNEESVNAGSGLTSLPYQFVPANHYLLVPGYPAAVEKTSGKVGVSLLNETFPLMLNGDSLTYEKVWNALLTSIRPASRNNISVQFPVCQDVKTSIELNNFESPANACLIGKDTLFPDYSVINGQSATGTIVPAESGWVSFQDLEGNTGAELYISAKQESNHTFQRKRTEEFIRAYNLVQSPRDSGKELSTDMLVKGVKSKLPDWLWFGIIMVGLAGLWIETKLR
jgi:hypothetical protein